MKTFFYMKQPFFLSKKLKAKESIQQTTTIKKQLTPKNNKNLF